MYNKYRNYRREQRAAHITKKARIIKEVFDSSPMSWTCNQLGRLDKAKVHCSCKLCQRKSTKLFGKTYNGISGYSATDRRKFEALAYID